MIMTDKIFIHNLKYQKINENPKEFIDEMLENGSFFYWMREDLSDFMIERQFISDIKHLVSKEHIYFTSSSNPRLTKMTAKIIKSCFDWKKIIKQIKEKYYEKTK